MTVLVLHGIGGPSTLSGVTLGETSVLVENGVKRARIDLSGDTRGARLHKLNRLLGLHRDVS